MRALHGVIFMPLLFGCESNQRAMGDGKILFYSDREGNYEIYKVRPDGSGLQNLSHNPADDYFAFVSKDGRQIWFLSDREQHWSGDVVGAWGFVMDLDGNVLRKQLGQEEFGREWSPDLRRYLKIAPDGGLFVVTPLAKKTERIAKNVQVLFEPTWSFCGEFITCVVRCSERKEIRVIDLSDTVRHRVENVGGISGPAFLSPDGNRVAFTCGNEDDQDVYSVILANGPEDIVNVTKAPGEDICCGWVRE